MRWPLILSVLWSTFLLLPLSVYADSKVLFYETFDSLAAIEANGGKLRFNRSQFERGLKGQALHLKQSDSLSYYPLTLATDSLDTGSIDFYFLPHSAGGLVELDSAGSQVMSFLGSTLWLEIDTGGILQSYAERGISLQRWHHAAMVWSCNKKSRNYFQIYLDGVPGVQHENWRGSCGASRFPKPFSLSVGSTFYYGWGEAVIDDLRVQRRALGYGTIRSRAKLIKSDPKYNLIEMLAPADGTALEAWHSLYDFTWAGPPENTYVLHVSTSSAFAAEQTLTYQAHGFGQYLWLSDLRALKERSQSLSNDFYWRISYYRSKPKKAVFLPYWRFTISESGAAKSGAPQAPSVSPSPSPTASSSPS